MKIILLILFALVCILGILLLIDVFKNPSDIECEDEVFNINLTNKQIGSNKR